MSEIASATRGVAHIGALIFRTELIKASNFDRYAGTSHEFFGKFWDGLSTLALPTVLVLDKAVVYVRQVTKQWDESYIATILGVRRYDRLLPPELAIICSQTQRHLSRIKALQIASQPAASEKLLVAELVQTFDTFSVFSRTFSRVPQPIARQLWRLARMSSEFLDVF